MGQPLGFQRAEGDHHRGPGPLVSPLLGDQFQPENCDFFLDREKDGFPQRFLWVPTIDPYAPADRPEPVTPVDVIVPDFGCDEEYLVSVPESVTDEILAHRHLVLTGSTDIDPLDGHLMLTRLKVAFGLALLEGRRDIDEFDWKIGGELLAVSKRARDDVRFVLDDRRRNANVAKAHNQADREAIIAERLTEERQQRVAKAISRKLQRVGQRAGRTCFRRGLDHPAGLRTRLRSPLRHRIPCLLRGDGRPCPQVPNGIQLAGTRGGVPTLSPPPRKPS